MGFRKGLHTACQTASEFLTSSRLQNEGKDVNRRFWEGVQAHSGHQRLVEEVRKLALLRALRSEKRSLRTSALIEGETVCKLERAADGTTLLGDHDRRPPCLDHVPEVSGKETGSKHAENESKVAKDQSILLSCLRTVRKASFKQGLRQRIFCQKLVSSEFEELLQRWDPHLKGALRACTPG